MSIKIYNAYRAEISHLNDVLLDAKDQIYKKTFDRIKSIADKMTPQGFYKSMNFMNKHNKIDLGTYDKQTLIFNIAKEASKADTFDLFNFDFGYRIYLDTNYAYLIPWGSNNYWDNIDYRYSVIGYSYWNNTDAPIHVSKEEWEARSIVWRDLLKQPVLIYNIIKLSDPYLYADFEVEYEKHFKMGWFADG